MSDYILITFAFCVYGIIYCAFAIKVVLIHKEVKINNLKDDMNSIYSYYLKITQKYNEKPIDDPTINDIKKDIIRITKKLSPPRVQC